MENELFFSEVWERFKPSKKLPLEFESKLKQSCFSMMAEVQKLSVEKDRQRMQKQLSDFINDEPIQKTWFSSPQA